jgi:hypothetical protein
MSNATVDDMEALNVFSVSTSERGWQLNVSVPPKKKGSFSAPLFCNSSNRWLERVSPV